jgi:hypothetical protein
MYLAGKWEWKQTGLEQEGIGGVPAGPTSDMPETMVMYWSTL